MLVLVAEFLVLAGVIAAAGTVLARCADAIAERTGLGRLLVGSVLLAGATSLPELAVDMNAVWIGAADLAVGDLMGSSLFNLLILALLDLMHRRRRAAAFSRQAASHALSATMCIVLAATAGLGLLLGNKWNFTLLGLGPGVLAILVFYLGGLRMVFYDQQFAARQLESAPTAQPAHRVMTLRPAIAGYLGATAVILVVAPFLAHTAEALAEQTGLGRSFVGTTLVALSTSLPELVSSFAALRMGAFDLALGNIFGSNSFNMLLLVPLDLLQPGSLLAVASPVHVISALATIIVTGVAVMGQLYQVEKRRLLLEPDALLVILLIVGSLALLYFGG